MGRHPVSVTEDFGKEILRCFPFYLIIVVTHNGNSSALFKGLERISQSYNQEVGCLFSRPSAQKIEPCSASWGSWCYIRVCGLGGTTGFPLSSWVLSSWVKLTVQSLHLLPWGSLFTQRSKMALGISIHSLPVLPGAGLGSQEFSDKREESPLP